MRKYKVIVKEKKPSKVIHFDGEELASTEKQVVMKWKRKFPFAIIKVTRIQKQPGVQINLIDAIKEAENEQI